MDIGRTAERDIDIAAVDHNPIQDLTAALIQVDGEGGTGQIGEIAAEGHGIAAHIGHRRGHARGVGGPTGITLIDRARRRPKTRGGAIDVNVQRRPIRSQNRGREQQHRQQGGNKGGTSPLWAGFHGRKLGSGIHGLGDWLDDFHR